MNEFKDSLKIMSYYHTSLRNIGVFTSTSFAGAIFSRYHKGQNKMIQLFMLLLSIVFNVIAVTISIFLIIDLENIKTLDNNNMIDKWLLIPKITLVLNLCILLMSMYMLFIRLYY